MPKEYCLFCDKDNKEKHQVILENDMFYARWDNYPVAIHHLHIHIIPRYEGDVENPRGGIRNIIPGKGNY